MTERQGFGCFFKKSGDYYLGGWEENQKKGIGLETNFDSYTKNERYNYYGMFSGGKREGTGTLEVNNNIRYSGKFKDN